MSDVVEQERCPECRAMKPRDPNDQHDVVLLRTDWRKAFRPDRMKLQDPIGTSPMCLQCYNRIAEQYSPSAPSFDQKGNRIP